MAVCARCARTIDDTAAVCPICGLDQHRPRGENEPARPWERFKDALVPYGDDDWSEVGPYLHGTGRGDNYGKGRRYAGLGVAVVVGLVVIASFLIIVTVR